MSEAGTVRTAGKMDGAKDVALSPEPGTVRDAIADLAGKGEGGEGQSEAGTNGDAIAEPAGKVDGDRSTRLEASPERDSGCTMPRSVDSVILELEEQRAWLQDEEQHAWIQEFDVRPPPGGA